MIPDARKKLIEVFTELEKQFHERFGATRPKTRWFFAPGRVNLIGEHIDYCGGHVLPASIDMGTFAVARENGQSTSRLYSTLMPNPVFFDAAAISHRQEDDWGNYPKGVFLEYHKKNAPIPGMDIMYHGNLPGGGLSRSASIEICTAMIVEAFSGFKLDEYPVENRKKMALLCQHAENHFVGVHCGIMDQAAVAMGKEGNAVYLNCDTLEFDYIPVEFKGYRLIIVDSNKDRKLSESRYNDRRKEMEQALAGLRSIFPIRNICDLTPDRLPEVSGVIGNRLLEKRVRHAVMENHRVELAYGALQAGKLEAFGRLLNESHRSLRDDYDVTGPELDCLFDVTGTLPGVLGSRMTGAGFGGCFIALVHKTRVDQYKNGLKQAYEKTIGYPPTCHIVTIGMEATEVIPPVLRSKASM